MLLPSHREGEAGICLICKAVISMNEIASNVGSALFMFPWCSKTRRRGRGEARLEEPSASGAERGDARISLCSRWTFSPDPRSLFTASREQPFLFAGERESVYEHLYIFFQPEVRVENGDSIFLPKDSKPAKVVYTRHSYIKKIISSVVSHLA